jgi:tetratricopeptide (TPR) repeat protein
MKKRVTILSFLFFSLLSICTYAQEGLEFILKAEEFKKSRNYDAALAEYDKAIKADPKNPEFLYRKAQLYFIKKDADNAIQFFEKTIAMQNDNLPAYLSLARLYSIKGGNESAIKAFESAYTLEKDNAKKIEYKTNIIKILNKQDKFLEAGQHIKDVLALDPNNLTTLFYDARLANMNGKYEQAKQSMVKATGLLRSDDPKEFAKYYYELGYAYYHLEKYNDARLAFDKANYGPFKPLIFRMTPPYFYNLAISYFKVYEIDESKKYLENALKIKTDFTQAHDLLLKIVAMKADKTAIIESMKRASEYEKDPQKKAANLANLCENQFAAGKFQDAVNSANACLAIQPQNAPIAFVKAMSLYKLKKIDEATTILQNLTKQPALEQDARAQYNFALGLIYSRTGKDTKMAENTLKKADFAGFKYAATLEIEMMNGGKVNDQPEIDSNVNTEPEDND